MKSAGKARNNGLYRHIRTSKEIIRNLLNDYLNNRSERPPLNTDKSAFFCVVKSVLYKVADSFDNPVSVT